MIVTLRITNKTEAETAIDLLKAYLAAYENEEVAEVVEKAPAKKAPAKKAPAKKSTKDIAAEAKAKTEEAIAKVKEEAKEEVKEEAPKGDLTYDDVIAVAKEVRKKADLASVKAVIKEFGGAKVSDIDPSDYAKFVDALKAL